MRALSAVFLLLALLAAPTWTGAGSPGPAQETSPDSGAVPGPTATATSPILLPSAPTPTPPAGERILVDESWCCTRLFWSPDSLWVAFVAKPKGVTEAGIFGAAVDGTGVRRLFPIVGALAPDWSAMAYPREGKTIVQDTATGRRWAVPSGGKAVRFSPSGLKMAWESGSDGFTHLDLRRRVVWLADRTGSNVQRIVTTYGGGLVGWSVGEANLLVSGRLSADGPSGLWSIPLAGGDPQLLVGVEGVRDPLLSPDSSWVAFYVAFGADPSQDGVWLVKTDGSAAKRLDLFGAYRWRSSDQLLLIPLDLAAPQVELIQINAASGAEARLPLPGSTVDIAGGDWQPSPDGNWIAYVSAQQGEVRLVPLP